MMKLNNPNYIVENEKIQIQYIKSNGAWTYHLIIPNSKDIKSKWGDIKVSGTIDGHKIKSKNLAPFKNSDKKLALNSDIRTAINKSGGDVVSVTLFVEENNTKINNSEIINCFNDAGVLTIFNKLNNDEQEKIISSILSLVTEEQKVDKIIKAINQLEKNKVVE